MPDEFRGRGAPLSDAGLATLTGQLGVGQPEIWAVIQVETRGSGYLADRRPKILFERHIFSGRTGGKFDSQHPDISNPQRGGYSGGAAEYDRLARAVALDRKAALESASWGLGQVMGFNFGVGGFPDAESMVKAMMASEDQQMSAMAGFIRSNKLDKHLQDHAWDKFASGYNGSSYADNNYDGKLNDAFTTLSAGNLPDLRIRSAQLYLTYRKIDPHGVDGLKGKNTTNAIKTFQTQVGLPATGELDDTTFAKLAEILDT
jgi:hypothetical protein